FAPRGVRLPAAEAANVERVRAQRHVERWVVELWVVRERDDGGATVRGEGGERLVGPLGRALHAGEAVVGRERTPRVDHHRGESGQGGHPCQRLGDVDGADEDQAQRRVEGLEKDRGAVLLDGGRLVAGGGEARGVEQGRGDTLRRRPARLEESLRS